MKYRGIRVDNGKWVHGNIVKTYDVNSKENFYHIIDEHDSLKFNDSNYQYDTHYEVEPDTIGQYTGLKDKNGVEIYEGDIVEVNGGEYEVVYKKYQFSLKEFYCASYDYPCDGFSESVCEVVGNIHN